MSKIVFYELAWEQYLYWQSQHGIASLKKVVNRLKEADEISGEYYDILNILEEMGRIASGKK